MRVKIIENNTAQYRDEMINSGESLSLPDAEAERLIRLGVAQRTQRQAQFFLRANTESPRNG